jgi:hypothetical protein
MYYATTDATIKIQGIDFNRNNNQNVIGDNERFLNVVPYA